MGMWLFGYVSGVISVFVLSLSVTIPVLWHMKRVDRNAGQGIGSGVQGNNPMEGIKYHGPEDTPGKQDDA